MKMNTEQRKEAVEAIMAMRPKTQSKSSKNRKLDIDHFLDDMEAERIANGDSVGHGMYLTAPSPGMTEKQRQQRIKAGKSRNMFYIGGQ